MQMIGVIFIAMGAIDLAGAWFFNFDLWGGFFGIQLPDIIWMFTPYIELSIGFFLFNQDGDNTEDQEDPDN